MGHKFIGLQDQMPLLSQQLTKGEAKLGTEIRKEQCPVKLNYSQKDGEEN